MTKKKKPVVFRGELANAEFIVPLNLDESIAKGQATGARSGECWLNAFRCLHEVTSDGHRLAWYVEGYAVLKGNIPFEHGWLVSAVNEKPGHVIDPTCHVYQTRGVPAPVKYVPALVWPVTECVLQACDQEFMPLADTALFSGPDRVLIEDAFFVALKSVFA